MSSASVPKELKPVPSSAPQTPSQDRTALVAAGKLPRFDPSARPLVGAKRDRIEEILSGPRDLVANGEFDAAKAAYLRIINGEGQSKEKIHRILYIVCNVELAELYETTEFNRHYYSQKAFMRLLRIYNDRSLLGDELISHFTHLESCYNKLLVTYPAEQNSSIEQLTFYRKHHGLWQQFSQLLKTTDNQRLTTADESQRGIEQSTSNYLAALEFINGETDPFYKLQRAKCLLRLAELNGENENGKAWGLQAKDLAFELVSERKLINLSDFNFFLNCLQLFYIFDPIAQAQIVEKRTIIQQEIDLQNPTSKEPPEKDNREVSQERDNRGLMRLFMLIVAGALIGAAFMLYRRNVVKL